MTAKPTTRTDIANMALDLLNVKAGVTDLDNPISETEKLCARWYENVKQSLLRSYNWNFAKERATILRVGSPAFEYSDAYKLPNDFVKLLEIMDWYEAPGDKSYEIEGDRILLNNGNATSINIKYIKNTEAITLFDPLFVNLLIIHLSIKLAYKLTMDKNLLITIQNMAQSEEMKAVSIFGQERPPKRIQKSRFVSAHYGFSEQTLERI